MADAPGPRALAAQGKDRTFTFDSVFDPAVEQSDVYGRPANNRHVYD